MSRATMGLLQGFGEGMATTGQFLAENRWDKQKQERLNQFRQQMREGDRAYQDQVREEQRGLLMQRDAQQRATQIQDMERQDSNVASWGTAVDGNTQYQVGYSRTGEEVARHEAGPAPRGESSLQWKDKAIPMGQDIEGNTIYGPGWVNPADGSVIPPRMAQQSYQPPPEAVQELLENAPNNPEYIRFFNEYYGEGAAESILEQSGSGQGASGGGQGGGESDSGRQQGSVPEGYSVEPSMMERAGNAMSGLLQRPESSQSDSALWKTADDVSAQGAVQRVKDLLRQNVLPRDKRDAQRALASGELTPEEERAIRQYLGQ